MQIKLFCNGGGIGMHCAKYLLERGDQVVSIENLNDYYDVKLKQALRNQLQGYERFRASLRVPGRGDARPRDFLRRQ